MAEVHQLIIKHGIEEARRQAVTKHERMVIEAAYQVLSDDAEKMGFTYSGFALTSLPHKPQTELVWKREGHNLTMLIQSGVGRSGKPLGLPYGSYARFILLFLQSEAIRTGSREIELGRSMRVWLGCMGLSIGGTTYRLVNEQARRISGCSLTFYADRYGAQIESRGGFVKTAISMSNVIDEQPGLADRVLLDEDFYRALRDHPVPLSESALRNRHSVVARDVGVTPTTQGYQQPQCSPLPAPNFAITSECERKPSLSGQLVGACSNWCVHWPPSSESIKPAKNGLPSIAYPGVADLQLRRHHTTDDIGTSPAAR